MCHSAFRIDNYFGLIQVYTLLKNTLYIYENNAGTKLNEVFSA